MKKYSGAGRLWLAVLTCQCFSAAWAADQPAMVPIVSTSSKPVPPSYVDIPETVHSLNGRRGHHYVKLIVRVQVPKAEDVAPVKSAMPRLQDLLVVYIREMDPAELRDPIDMNRLRNELVVRVNTAVAPVP